MYYFYEAFRHSRSKNLHVRIWLAAKVLQVSWNPEKWYMWHHAAWYTTSAITDSWMHSLYELLIMGIYLIIYFLINFRSTMDCSSIIRIIHHIPMMTFTVWYLLHFMKIWLYLKSLPYTKNQRNLILKMYTVSVAFMSSNRKCLSKYFSLIVFQLIYLQQSIWEMTDWEYHPVANG